MALTQEQINFCNQQIRPLADAMATVYRTYKTVKQNWDAQSLGAVFTRDATVIVDGAPADGRQQITNNSVNGIMDIGFNIASWLEKATTDGSGTETDANLFKILTVMVNGQSKV